MSLSFLTPLFLYCLVCLKTSETHHEKIHLEILSVGQSLSYHFGWPQDALVISIYSSQFAVIFSFWVVLIHSSQEKEQETRGSDSQAVKAVKKRIRKMKVMVNSVLTWHVYYLQLNLETKERKTCVQGFWPEVSSRKQIQRRDNCLNWRLTFTFISFLPVVNSSLSFCLLNIFISPAS